MRKAVIHPCAPLCRTTPLPIPSCPPCSPKGSLDQSRAVDNEQKHTPLWGEGQGWGAGDPPEGLRGVWGEPSLSCKGAGAPWRCEHTGPRCSSLWHQEPARGRAPITSDGLAPHPPWPHTLPGPTPSLAMESLPAGTARTPVAPYPPWLWGPSLQDPAHLLPAPLVSCIPALECCQGKGLGTS